MAHGKSTTSSARTLLPAFAEDDFSGEPETLQSYQRMFSALTTLVENGVRKASVDFSQVWDDSELDFDLEDLPLRLDPKLEERLHEALATLYEEAIDLAFPRFFERDGGVGEVAVDTEAGTVTVSLRRWLHSQRHERLTVSLRPEASPHEGAPEDPKLERLRALWAMLRTVLRSLGAERVEIAYTGAGGAGDIPSLAFEPKQSALDPDVERVIRQFAYDVLAWGFEEWQEDEGSSGKLTLDVVAETLHADHGWEELSTEETPRMRVVQVATSRAQSR